MAGIGNMIWKTKKGIWLIFGIFLILALSQNASALTYIDSCQTLSSNDDYAMNASITTDTSGSCFSLSSGGNITFDGSGFNITMNGTGSVLSFQDTENISIMNLIINVTSSPQRIIVLSNANGTTITGSVIEAMNCSSLKVLADNTVHAFHGSGINLTGNNISICGNVWSGNIDDVNASIIGNNFYFQCVEGVSPYYSNADIRGKQVNFSYNDVKGYCDNTTGTFLFTNLKNSYVGFNTFTGYGKLYEPFTFHNVSGSIFENLVINTTGVTDFGSYMTGRFCCGTDNIFRNSKLYLNKPFNIYAVNYIGNNITWDNIEYNCYGTCNMEIHDYDNVTIKNSIFSGNTFTISGISTTPANNTLYNLHFQNVSANKKIRVEDAVNNNYTFDYLNSNVSTTYPAMDIFNVSNFMITNSNLNSSTYGVSATNSTGTINDSSLFGRCSGIDLQGNSVVDANRGILNSTPVCTLLGFPVGSARTRDTASLNIYNATVVDKQNISAWNASQVNVYWNLLVTNPLSASCSLADNMSNPVSSFSGGYDSMLRQFTQYPSNRTSYAPYALTATKVGYNDGLFSIPLADNTVLNVSLATRIPYIESPLNITYNETRRIWFNVTGDASFDICLVNWGAGNHTMTNSSGNYNYLNDSMPNGNYVAEFFCNNTVSGLGYNSVSFTVAALLPIWVDSPVNSTYSNGSIWFNVFLGFVGDTCLVDYGYGNKTMTNSTGNWNYFNGSMADGNYLAKFFCNDTIGDMGFNSVHFTIDSTPPVITIQYPLPNILHNDSSIWFNVTLNEAGYSCIVNYGYGGEAMTNSSGNWHYFNGSMANGIYLAEFYCTDLVGNLGYNSTTFKISIGTIYQSCGQAIAGNKTYVMNRSINLTSAGGTCLSFNVNNVTFDGNGFTVSGNVSGRLVEVGIVNNLTIMNLNLDCNNTVNRSMNMITNLSNLLIKNVNITGNCNEFIVRVVQDWKNNITFRDVNILSSKYGKNPLLVQNVANLSLTGVNIINSTATGISLTNITGFFASDMNVINSTTALSFTNVINSNIGNANLTNSGGTVISISNSSSISFTGMGIINSTSAGLSMTNGVNLLVDNVLMQNVTTGLSLTNVTGNVSLLNANINGSTTGCSFTASSANITNSICSAISSYGMFAANSSAGSGTVNAYFSTFIGNVSAVDVRNNMVVNIYNSTATRTNTYLLSNVSFPLPIMGSLRTRNFAILNCYNCTMNDAENISAIDSSQVNVYWNLNILNPLNANINLYDLQNNLLSSFIGNNSLWVRQFFANSSGQTQNTPNPIQIGKSGYYAKTDSINMNTNKDYTISMRLIVPMVDPSSITGQLVLTLGFGIMGLFAVMTLLGFGYITSTGKPDPETIAKIMIGVVIIILMIVAVWTGIVHPP